MNTNRKSEISAFLENFQKRLSAVNKAVKKRTDIEDDAVVIEDAITKMGQPSYKDDAKMTQLAILEMKLKTCRAALEEQKAKIGQELANIAETIAPGGLYACEILQEVVNNRLETVTRCLLTFSLTRRSAERIAQQTDACNGSFSSALSYNQLHHQVRKYTGARFGDPESVSAYGEMEANNVLDAAQKIELVLAEAVSSSPNLVKFIPFAAAAGAEQTSVETLAQT